MRVDVVSGSLGIVGTGLAMALPEQRWIGWLIVFLGIVVFIFSVRNELKDGACERNCLM